MSQPSFFSPPRAAGQVREERQVFLMGAKEGLASLITVGALATPWRRPSGQVWRLAHEANL